MRDFVPEKCRHSLSRSVLVILINVLYPRNSPIATTTGIVPQAMYPSAWFNRTSTTTHNPQQSLTSAAHHQSPSNPLNSPVQSMLGVSSPPPSSIDTAFFSLSQQPQYQSESQLQQQQALSPEAFIHATTPSMKRYPNGGASHSRSGSTSNSQLQSPTTQSPTSIKVKSERNSAAGSTSNAGLFSGGAVSTSRCVVVSFFNSLVRFPFPPFLKAPICGASE